MKPDKFDAGTSVKGLDYIDVPPNGKRDYKLNFYAHKEGITMCKVTAYCLMCLSLCFSQILTVLWVSYNIWNFDIKRELKLKVYRF